MSVFREREHAFEAAFAHEQDIAFEVKARRNRLICLWAARKMGLAGEAAKRYALDVVAAEIGHNDDAIVVRLLGELRAHGINMSEEKLRTELGKCARRAHQEITGKSPRLPTSHPS